jgi:Ser/Thr protein kinase RdoA (MazF antagonist)
MKIYNTYRIRGAFILETDKGLKLLKNFESSKNRVEFENVLHEHLLNMNYPNSDQYVRNIAGEIITEDTIGNRYVLKNWYPGEECNLREEADVEAAASNLAILHTVLRELELDEEQVTFNSYINLTELFEKRNRELKRVRGYIREKRKKNEFEMCYMNCYDEFYNQALDATKMLEESDYLNLLTNAIEHRHICHGNYTYHNIIMLKAGKLTQGKSTRSFSDNGWNKEDSKILSAADIHMPKLSTNIATTNFDKACVGIQITDLYQFIRKVMEKNDWDVDLGSRILDTYEKIVPVNKEEYKLLYILLHYPEKFWKITNFYYNSKKSWVPQRNIQKLMGIQEQGERKSQFLKCLENTFQ